MLQRGQKLSCNTKTVFYANVFRVFAQRIARFAQTLFRGGSPRRGNSSLVAGVCYSFYKTVMQKNEKRFCLLKYFAYFCNVFIY